MATLCIILRDNLRPGHPSPHTAARHGDVVSVYEDDIVPGTKTVASPDFALVRLPGIPAARLQFLLEPEVSDLRDIEAIPTKYRRRQFLPDRLTRDQLDRAKETSLTYRDAPTASDVEADSIRDHLADKRDGRTLREEGRVI